MLERRKKGILAEIRVLPKKQKDRSTGNPTSASGPVWKGANDQTWPDQPRCIPPFRVCEHGPCLDIEMRLEDVTAAFCSTVVNADYLLGSWRWWNSCPMESEAVRACATVRSLGRGPLPTDATRLRRRRQRRHCRLPWRRWRKTDRRPGLNWTHFLIRTPVPGVDMEINHSPCPTIRLAGDRAGKWQTKKTKKNKTKQSQLEMKHNIYTSAHAKLVVRIGKVQRRK